MKEGHLGHIRFISIHSTRMWGPADVIIPLDTVGAKLLIQHQHSHGRFISGISTSFAVSRMAQQKSWQTHDVRLFKTHRVGNLVLVWGLGFLPASGPSRLNSKPPGEKNVMFCMSLQLKAIGVKHMTYHPSTEGFFSIVSCTVNWLALSGITNSLSSFSD